MGRPLKLDCTGVSMQSLPIEIKKVLSEFKIDNVVNGYFTQVLIKGTSRLQTAYTGWNKDGQPIIVLYKIKGKPWSKNEY